MIMSMNTAAVRPQDFAIPATSEAGRGAGVLDRVWKRFVDAQMRAASATVARQMQSLSTDHLRALGLSDSEIKDLRTKGRLVR